MDKIGQTHLTENRQKEAVSWFTKVWHRVRARVGLSG